MNSCGPEMVAVVSGGNQMKNNKTLGVRIDCETWDMLTMLAKFSNMTVSAIVRQMFASYVKQLYNRIPAEKLEELKGEK